MLASTAAVGTTVSKSQALFQRTRSRRQVRLVCEFAPELAFSGPWASLLQDREVCAFHPHLRPYRLFKCIRAAIVTYISPLWRFERVASLDFYALSLSVPIK